MGDGDGLSVCQVLAGSRICDARRLQSTAPLGSGTFIGATRTGRSMRALLCRRRRSSRRIVAAQFGTQIAYAVFDMFPVLNFAVQ